MILDCVCVDIRISRSPLPRMLAMVLLCGYSGHGDMETLAPAPAPCEPLSCPHSCPRQRGQARAGGAARCTNIPFNLHSADASHCGVLHHKQDYTCPALHRLRFQENNTSNEIQSIEVGPRLSKQLGTRNSSEFCPTDLSWSTLFVDPAPGHRQWSVVSAATRPRLETFAHPLISNTQILGFMLAITRGLMAICKMIMGGRKQWWQLWDTFP